MLIFSETMLLYIISAPEIQRSKHREGFFFFFFFFVRDIENVPPLPLPTLCFGSDRMRPFGAGTEFCFIRWRGSLSAAWRRMRTRWASSLSPGPRTGPCSPWAAMTSACG